MGHSYEACSSIKHNGNGYQPLHNSYHTLDTHSHFGNNHPLTQKIENLCIFRQDCSTERFERISYRGNQVNKRVWSLFYIYFKIDLARSGYLAEQGFEKNCGDCIPLKLYFENGLAQQLAVFRQQRTKGPKRSLKFFQQSVKTSLCGHQQNTLKPRLWPSRCSDELDAFSQNVLTVTEVKPLKIPEYGCSLITFWKTN